MKKKRNNNVPKVVFSGNITEATMLRTFLANAEIDAFLKDEFTGTLAPFFNSPGGYGSVKIVVSDSDFEKARLIVADYLKNIND